MTATADRQRQIEERYRRRVPAPRPGLQRRDDPVAPLSFEQERLWLAGADTPAYNSAMRVDLTGVVDPARLERAIAAVVARHSVLRSTFHDRPGGPCQRVHPTVPTPLRVADVTPDQLDAAVSAAAREPFQLEAGPVLRCLLLRLEPARSVLVIVVHHLASDGWFRILFRDLSAAYAGQTLNPVPGYADHVRRQRGLAASAGWKRLVAERAQMLAGAEPVHLYGDRNGADPNVSGVNPVRVTAALGQRVRQAAADARTSPFVVLLAGLHAITARYSRQRDLVLAAPVDGRDHPDLNDVMGFFVNLLPVRQRVAPDTTFRQLLAGVRESWLDAFEHRAVPLAAVLDAARERGATWSPSVVLNFDPGGKEPIRLGEAAGFASGVDTGGAKFDLNLFLSHAGEGFEGALIYRASMFSERAASDFVRAWSRLLDAGLSTPDRPLRELDLTPAVIQTGTPAQRESRPARTLTARFRDVARRRPDRTAVVCGQRRVSYRELDAWSDRLAQRLRSRGAAPGSLVGLCVDRSAELVAGVLGIMKAGCGYLPLDPAYPRQRLRLMLADSRAVAVLGALPAEPGQPQPADPPAPPVPGSPAEPRALPVIELDAADEQPAEAMPDVPPGSTAYVIYTSGSTGRPKGVVISHANVDRLLSSTEKWFDFGAEDVWTLFHSYAFDFSVWELWGALAYGGALVVTPYQVSRSPEQFLELLDAERVTVLNQTPSAFAQLTAAVAARGRGPAALRTVIFGGEALDFGKLRGWRQHVPPDRTQLVNMYGITETTVHVTCHPVREADVDSGAGSLIGEPIPDLSVWLLDEHGQPVSHSMPGEIYVGGVGLADGYLGDPRRTALRFVPSPFGVGERLYRSGDLACRTGDGQLRYLGRADQQIKLRGFRIELGEIAAALREHPAVADAAADLRDDPARGPQLAGYVALAPGASAPSIEELRSHLQGLLPAHAVPSGYAIVDALPLTPNGKLDRAALPPPRSGAGAGRVAAVGETERTLTGIFATALGLPEVGATDNFFQLGGDSIVALRVVAAARAAGIAIRPGDVLTEQTPRAVAAIATPAPEPAAPAPAQTAGPTPMQQWFLEQSFAEPAHWNQSLWLRPPQDWSAARFERAFGAAVRRHPALSGDGLPGGGHEPSPVVQTLNLRTVPDAHRGARLGRAVAAAQTGLDLERGPLIRALVAEGLPEGARILLVAHHLVVDAVSWSVFLEDLHAGYAGAALPPVTDPAASHAGSLARYAAGPAGAREARFWAGQATAAPDPLPLDHPDAAGVEESASTTWRQLDSDRTARLLRHVSAPDSATLEEVLLTGALLAVRRWSGARRLMVDVERHGREPVAGELDLSRSVGWFTAVFPVSVDADSHELLDALATALRGAPHRGAGYGALRHLGPPHIRRTLEALPEPQLAFNYLGQRPAPSQSGGEFTRAVPPPLPRRTVGDRAPSAPRSRALCAEAEVVSGQVRIGWTYDGRVSDVTAERLADDYLAALTGLVDAGPTRGPPPANSRGPGSVMSRLIESAPRWAPAWKEPHVTADIVTAYRLTPMQHLMLAHSIGAPTSDACFVQYGLRVSGPFEPERYRAAWQSLVARHTALRTCFAWRGLEEPLQVVLSDATVPLTVLDYRDTDGDELEARLTELAATESRTGFELTAPPLLRLTVVRLPGGAWHVLIGMHHLIVDGWSAEQLLREAAGTYAGAGPSQPAPEFGSYLAWLDGQDFHGAEQHWNQALASLPAGAGFPGALSRPGRRRSSALRESRRELDAVTVAALRERSRSARVTLSTMVRAAWGALLARYAGVPEAVFAVTVAGRPAELPEASETVGPFLNNLPVRVGQPGADLVGWLAGLQRDAARSEQHQWCSPAQIQEWAGRDAARALCDTLLVFQNYPGDQELPALGPRTRFERWRPAGPTVRTGFPLTLTVTVTDIFTMRTTVDSGVVSRPGVQRLEEDFCAVLDALAAGRPDLPLPPPWQPPAESGDRARRATVAYRPPGTDVEKQVAGVFAEVLEVDQVGADDDFFDAGGNSLAAVHLSWRLRDSFGVELPLETVFTSRTPAALAAVLDPADPQPALT